MFAVIRQDLEEFGVFVWVFIVVVIVVFGVLILFLLPRGKPLVV